MATPTQDVSLWNETGTALSTVAKDSTATDLPAGTSSGIVLVGGVQPGSPDTYRAVALDASGRPAARLYDAAGNAITSTSSAVDINIKSQSINLAVSKNATANAATNPISTQLTDGSANITTSSGALDVNLKSVTGTRVQVSKDTNANSSTNPLYVTIPAGGNPPLAIVSGVVNLAVEFTISQKTSEVQVTSPFPYTVTSGKTFYMLAFSVTRYSFEGGGTFRLVANGVTYAESSLIGTSQAATTEWVRTYVVGIPIATSGQTITWYMQSDKTTSIIWFFQIIGFEV